MENRRSRGDQSRTGRVTQWYHQVRLLLSFHLAAFCEVCCTSRLSCLPGGRRGRGRGSTRDFCLLFFDWSVSPATLLIAGSQRKGVITFSRLHGRGRPREKGWEKEVGELNSGVGHLPCSQHLFQKKLSCPFIPRASECCFYRKEKYRLEGEWLYVGIYSYPHLLRQTSVSPD